MKYFLSALLFISVSCFAQDSSFFNKLDLLYKPTITDTSGIIFYTSAQPSLLLETSTRQPIKIFDNAQNTIAEVDTLSNLKI